MSAGHDVFFSNKVEILYNRLKINLFNPAISPFCRRLIIVPSPAIKSWLMLRLADDPEVGIATGIEVAYLDQTINKLCRLESFLNGTELALLIEMEIREIIASSDQEELWNPLLKYLKIENNSLSKKSERRLIALSQKLASLFKDYGIYGGALLDEWEGLAASNWQIALWKRLFIDRFSYPAAQLKSADVEMIEVRRETRLYLFSISFMPQIYHDFLNRLSTVLPVSYYQLSPCQLFWTDILSDRESRRLQEYWKKRGISKNQETDLEHFLRHRNALLANFGRLGREMASLIEDSSALTDELYALPASIKDQLFYQDFLTDEMAYFGTAEFSALDVIQADMTLLRHPAKGECIVLHENDRSIQVHSASSKLRECQVVYDLIMGLIDKHATDSDPICPEDIIVMSPDIMDYQALIKAVFGSSESQLDYHVLDLHMPSQNELIQALMHLLELPKTRWDSLSLLQLFEYKCFQESQKLKSDDLQQLGQWVLELGILWGFDSQHRLEVLSKDYGSDLFDSNTFGSWEKGFSRLLSQAVDERCEQSVSGTRLELAGQWIALVRTLKEDLKPVTDQTQKTVQEWTQYLQELAEKYLGYDEKEESHQPLFDQLYLLKRAERAVPEKRFGFGSIYTQIKEAFCRERISFRETHLHAVRFCSMLPMRAIPAKVIVLMGMQEGVFPKQDQKDSLNLLQGACGSDYCPSSTDYDRYLFLEALLSARQYFVATYQNTDPESGKEQPPSLLISEMLAYLDQACLIGSEQPSVALVRHHPFHAYDSGYFTENSAFCSYSISQYKAASSFYHLEKQPQHLFFKDFTINQPASEVSEIVIDLKQLSSMGKNPLKAFLNASLGLFLREDERPEIEEGLILSKLDQALIKREAIYGSFEETIADADEKGVLPPGVFKEVAVTKVYEDYEELKKAYEKLEIRPENVFTIEFSEHCRAPAKIDNNWTLPPLEVPYRDGITIKIIGKLPEVCPKGLLSHIDKNPQELPKIWPEFLVYQGLIDQYQLGLEKNLFLMKAGIAKQIASEKPMEALKNYVDYYFLSLNNVSPLQPAWTPNLLKGDPNEIQKAVQKSTNKEYSYDETVLWLCRQGCDLNILSMSEWQNHAERLFAEPLQKWMA